MMTREEGQLTDRIARGESVPGGPGACTRPGCAHGSVCSCASYVNTPWPAEAAEQTRAPLPSLDDAEQPALEGLEPPAEPEQLELEPDMSSDGGFRYPVNAEPDRRPRPAAAQGFELADHMPAAVADRLTLAAMDDPPPAVSCPECGCVHTAYAGTPHVARCSRYTAERALLEAASARWLELTETTLGPDETPLGLLDSGIVDLRGFWVIVNTVCVCYSCGGQCGGCGHEGWCGQSVLVCGRLLCAVCRETIDLVDTHRAGIAVRLEEDHIRLEADPFETYRKVTARLTPAEARYLAGLLEARAAELEITISGGQS